MPIMSSSTGTLSVDPKALVGWPVELDCQVRGSESLLKDPDGAHRVLHL